jgi:hypothetical protein
MPRKALCSSTRDWKWNACYTHHIAAPYNALFGSLPQALSILSDQVNRCNENPRCSVYSATRKEKSKSKHGEESRRGNAVYQLVGLHLDLSSSWHGSPPAASLSAAFFFMRSSCACVRPPRTGAASGTGGIVQVGGVIVLPLQTS